MGADGDVCNEENKHHDETGWWRIEVERDFSEVHFSEQGGQKGLSEKVI